MFPFAVIQVGMDFSTMLIVRSVHLSSKETS